MLKTLSPFFVLFLTVTAVPAEIVDTRSADFPAGDLADVRFVVGAGKLDIKGSPEATSVHVQADFDVDAPTSRVQQALANMRFDASPRGGTLYIETSTEGDWHDDDSGRIHLTVTVPDRMALDIRDGSGSITVGGVQGEVTIEDGSGDIELAQIGGNLSIRDGSGDIDLEGVSGTIEIRDGSGSIDVRDAMSVTVNDSSGDIDIERAGGDVVVSDSSGSINVRDVDGDFEVRRDSSGSIRHSGVRGSVRVPNN